MRHVLPKSSTIEKNKNNDEQSAITNENMCAHFVRKEQQERKEGSMWSSHRESCHFTDKVKAKDAANQQLFTFFQTMMY